jgi:hypothetical protein
MELMRSFMADNSLRMDCSCLISASSFILDAGSSFAASSPPRNTNVLLACNLQGGAQGNGEPLVRGGRSAIDPRRIAAQSMKKEGCFDIYNACRLRDPHAGQIFGAVVSWPELGMMSLLSTKLCWCVREIRTAY